jgi:hypothetical protein
MQLAALERLGQGRFVVAQAASWGPRCRACTAPQCRSSSDLQVWRSAYAARWYSLITPPRIFRRCTTVSSGMTADSS